MSFVLRFFLFVHFVFLGALSGTAFSAATDERIAVIEIYNQKGKVIGKEAGVFVSKDEVLTHYYVFSGVDKAILRAGGKAFQIKGISGRNREKKLLKIKIEGNGFRPASFGSKIKEGQQVFIKAPGGDPVKGKVGSLGDRAEIELSSTLPRIRGLPVFDEKDAVIGIIEFFLRNKDVVHAIPLCDGISFEPLGLLSIREWREKRTEEWMASDRGKRQTIVYLMGIGKYEEAIPKLEGLIEEATQDKEAYFKLGVCYAKLERYRQALDAYEKYTALSPDDVKGHYNLGICHLFLDRPKEALAAFSEAISIDKNHLRSHYNLGILYAASGKKEEANKEYEFLKGFNSKAAKVLSDRLLEYIEKGKGP
ncbi:MAG: hypothetical protein DRH17_02205 [Deltaproteobacteria bacterium]|nr:MAG: hypothetical protein DRH17_02205 [Deltaproteobacteria bacterium]